MFGAKVLLRKSIPGAIEDRVVRDFRRRCRWRSRHYSYWTTTIAHSTFMDRGFPLRLHRGPTSPLPPPVASPSPMKKRAVAWVLGLEIWGREWGTGMANRRGCIGASRAYPSRGGTSEGQKGPYGNTIASYTPDSGSTIELGVDSGIFQRSAKL
jgi:hypothetical protein